MQVPEIEFLNEVPLKPTLTTEGQDECPVPETESNQSERAAHHHHDLQVEQFMHTTPNITGSILYSKSSKAPESVREATMALYNSLNASDHI